MRHFSYNLGILVSGLCLILHAPSSFGSDRFTHEEAQEKSVAPATALQRAIPSESTLPQDVRVHILSFLSNQKDILRIGTVSRSWRKAAEKVWEKRWLDLSYKRLTVADYQALVEGIFPRLRLNNVKLDEERTNILATCSHLQALELRNNYLCVPTSLIKLLSLTRLSHIDLYCNSIDDEGVKAIAGALSQNRTLTTANLGWNSIGDEGAKAIAEVLSQNRTLTTFVLGFNSIGDEGARAIAGTLSQNMTLTMVDLSDNSIDDKGATAIAEALKQNMTLTTFYLGGNKIGVEGAKALEDLKRSRPSLKLEY